MSWRYSRNVVLDAIGAYVPTSGIPAPSVDGDWAPGSEAPRARTDSVSIGFEIQNEENYVGHRQCRSREKLKRPRQESNL
jgi:hypothetical protein